MAGQIRILLLRSMARRGRRAADLMLLFGLPFLSSRLGVASSPGGSVLLLVPLAILAVMLALVVWRDPNLIALVDIREIAALIALVLDVITTVLLPGGLLTSIDVRAGDIKAQVLAGLTVMSGPLESWL
jgi:hypothetical protein